ncbi:MAG TPA: SDR family oxidoreductase [Caulobacteraceae bacterium]|nr:SDR family oxidoreductase [Caulobacteraceae bacterium]
MADKIALVVGASRGIGLGLVKELAGRGWKVIGTRRSASSDKGLEAFAKESGGKVTLESVDIEDPASIDALVGRLQGQALDLVFVNAGISGSHSPAAKMTREEVAQVFMTNSVGPVHIAESLKDQVRDGGVIALMTSGLGSVASDFSFMGGGANLYSASKAALNKMTRGFTNSLGDRKITVLTMSPGWVRTDMGGPDAWIGVDESAKGVIDVVEAKAGTGEHGFYGHDGKPMPW